MIWKFKLKNNDLIIASINNKRNQRITLKQKIYKKYEFKKCWTITKNLVHSFLKGNKEIQNVRIILSFTIKW
jgi:hypothetical protein